MDLAQSENTYIPSAVRKNLIYHKPNGQKKCFIQKHFLLIFDYLKREWLDLGEVLLN